MAGIIAIGPSSFAQEDQTPLRMLEDAGFDVRDNPFRRRLTEAEIITHLEGADGLIAGLEPLNRKVIASAAPRLKAIARVGIGVANVDFDAAEEFGVQVSSTPEGPIRSVSEMTIAALLCLCRGLIPANAALHAGEWKKAIGLGLNGTKVLFIGYGRIGRHTAALLRPFGAEILVRDPYCDPETLTDGERAVTLEEGLGMADVITLHASGEDCLLGPDAFARMKEGVILLNSARGALVDEAALIQALDTGRVAGVWFDAFWQEPYTGPLTACPQALLTPHIATYSRQCRLEMESQAVTNILHDLGKG
jgi:D-3-phosphoglycerate dehydrogenase / 2-oxoglutarate reductase